MENRLAEAQRSPRDLFARPVFIGAVALGLTSAAISGSAHADPRSATASLGQRGECER